MNGLLQDVRYALRQLRKSPGFTAVAVLTLALGIGANTAMFSVIDAVLLRPLPFRDPDRLVSLYEDRSHAGFARKEFTPANYADCKEQKQIFKDVAAVDADRFYNLTSKGAAPEKLWAEGVSWNVFSILGTRPLLGRVFRAEEDMPGSEHVVLISHRLWRGRFGGDSNLVGQDIFLNGEKYSVVGVMPPGFSFPDKNADLWVPIAFTPQGLADRGAHFLMVIAALQSGVSIERANAQLLVFSQRLRQQHMDIMRFVDGFVAEPLRRIYTRGVRGGLIVLVIAVGFILLIACANIANLLLSKVVVRQHEIALREALGATRRRIVRQLMTESSVLSTAGGAMGVLLAHSAFTFLKELIPVDLSRTVSLNLNLRVLALTILISFASAFLFGLVPALQISKTDVNDSLKDGGRGIGGQRRSLGSLLVVGEIAVCLILLVASGLLLESFANLRRGDPGFRPEHVLTAEISVARTMNPDFTRRAQFFQTILERVRALPEVKSAGFTSVLPLIWKSGVAGFLPEGAVSRDISYGALDRVVSPGYFEAMKISLVRGRLFDNGDGRNAPLVAIVNETMARKFWPNQNVIGKRFSFVGTTPTTNSIQIVGVVGDVKQMGLDAPPKEEMFFPYWQAQGNSMKPTTQAGLLGGLATLALVLASVGIYGVMAYLVGQRTQEMGIRMALGARRSDILGLVVGKGMKLALLGIGFGLVAGLAVTRLMGSLLYGVRSTDPFTFAAISVLLASTAAFACYIPARRASKVDPMVALRYE